MAGIEPRLYPIEVEQLVYDTKNRRTALFTVFASIEPPCWNGAIRRIHPSRPLRAVRRCLTKSRSRAKAQAEFGSVNPGTAQVDLGKRIMHLAAAVVCFVGRKRDCKTFFKTTMTEPYCRPADRLIGSTGKLAEPSPTITWDNPCSGPPPFL